MASTKIDTRTALVVIDLQKGLAGMIAASTWSQVVRNSRQLADAFRERGLPVVLVVADAVPQGRTETSSRLGKLPPGFAGVVDDLAPQAGDIHVVKRSWGAFATTDLEAELKRRGVTQVVVAGVATASGVEATARQAYEAGFNVTLVLDAMADTQPHARDHSVAHVFPRVGETGTTAEVLAILP